MISSLAFAYSSWANPRRLEDPLYVFWGLVMHHLVHDFGSEVLVAPQSKIYKDPKGRARPDTSTMTTTGTNKGSVAPDFSLLGVILADRTTKELLRHVDYPSSITDWLTLQVVLTELYGLFEIKSMPSRHHVSQENFEMDLIILTNFAIDQVEKQALVAFEEPSYKVDTLILIVAAGEWWRFRLAERSEFVDEVVDEILGDISDKSENDNKEKDDSDENEDKDSTFSPSQSEPPLSPRKQPVEKGPKTRRFTELDPDLVAPFEPDVEDAIPPPGMWSGHILFGTGQSNQCWYLIHRELRRRKDQLYNAAVDAWDADDEDRSEEETDGDFSDDD